MNLRNIAIENGQLTYNSKRPCRAGHTSDRYSSNGMCIECIKLQTESRREACKTARGKRNLALAASMRDHAVMSKQSDWQILDELGEVLRHSSTEVVAQVHQYIHSLYLASPTPRALTRDDLLTFMDFRDGVVQNYKDLELSHDEPVCVIRAGIHYDGVQCMEVLRGTRLNVKPVYKVNT